MILTCNSCAKKFVVPDSAITPAGRMVQCGSCGNKWKQYPLNEVKKKVAVRSSQPSKKNIQKTKKIKKAIAKKPREISLYSPEYLAKKHGIKIKEVKPEKITKQISKKKISFGFYNSLLVFIFFIISFSRILYFSQDIIIAQFPMSEFYLNYFFESVRNIFEIWKSLIISY
tara:strand:- start:602 stop:1114 length:513 start_codon:yes stop_codon:yes gene_type:complete